MPYILLLENHKKNVSVENGELLYDSLREFTVKYRRCHGFQKGPSNVFGYIFRLNCVIKGKGYEMICFLHSNFGDNKRKDIQENHFG